MLQKTKTRNISTWVFMENRTKTKFGRFRIVNLKKILTWSFRFIFFAFTHIHVYFKNCLPKIINFYISYNERV